VTAGLYDYLVFAHLLSFALWLSGAAASSLAGRAAFDAGLPASARSVCLQLRYAGQVLSRSGLACLLPVALTLLLPGQHGGVPALLVGLSWVLGLSWLAFIWVPRFVALPLSDRMMLGIETGFCAVAAMIALGIGLPSVLGYGPLRADWPGMKAVLGGLAFTVTGIMTWTLIPHEEALVEGKISKWPVATALSLGVLALFGLMLAAAWLGNMKPDL
jgi:hypothetical protein